MNYRHILQILAVVLFTTSILGDVFESTPRLMKKKDIEQLLSKNDQLLTMELPQKAQKNRFDALLQRPRVNLHQTHSSGASQNSNHVNEEPKTGRKI
jgi:phosphoribosylanthranilate isomerase